MRDNRRGRRNRGGGPAPHWRPKYNQTTVSYNDPGFGGGASASVYSPSRGTLRRWNDRQENKFEQWSNQNAPQFWYEDAPGAAGATAPVTFGRETQQQQPQQAVYDPAASASATNPWQAPVQAQPAATTQQQPQQQQQSPWTQMNGTTLTQQGNQGLSSANHPFFNPNQNYNVPGWPSAQFDEDSLAYMNWATNESPQGYYFNLLNQLGLGGLDNRSQAAQAMYEDYARGFKAAQAENIELWFPQFMAMQNIPWQIDQLSYDQLGVDQGDYAGGTRWALRGY